jgi:transposase
MDTTGRLANLQDPWDEAKQLMRKVKKKKKQSGTAEKRRNLSNKDFRHRRMISTLVARESSQSYEHINVKNMTNAEQEGVLLQHASYCYSELF